MLTEIGEAARLVGGGTDLVLHPPRGLTTLVDMSRLPLGYVEQRDGALVIGATVTLNEMLRHPLLSGFANGVLPLVLGQLGSPALRNAATIGGHLARRRLSDLAPVLLVLDAHVRCFDGADHAVPLADFYGSRWRERPIVLTELALPDASRELATGFVRFCRSAFDFAILNCAAAVAVEAGRITLARVAVGETPELARRVPEVEDRLLGGALDDGTVDFAARLARRVVATGPDHRASAAYRSQLVETGVRRSLLAAAGRPVVTP